MKTTQTISRKNLSTLYQNCCQSWQLIIGQHLAEQYDAKDIEVSNDLINKAYSEADSKQKALLEKFFKMGLGVHKEVTIALLCETLGIKEKDLYLFPADTKDPHERFLNACNIIPKISKFYNQGVVLNWEDTNQYKYAPYKNFGSGGPVVVDAWSCSLYSSVGFYFKDEKSAKAAYDNFPTIWEDYWGV